ncbi:hypothetical protein PR003_g31328 [Phytophthora rubi]|uniref:Uncharacterized protein n=1 Tax=Phytophthora rubi TaxID=129364 RepID=A0A6A3GUV7_9STRA|nr:hypothetical protein PR002_g30097 [Phytophthora rubi]KAE8960858.1 hypothetical protein PR001_g30238 [Phytophthora rubi]KAE9268789.1 hypothetical protein PR003_g31328 [Phytophthora rubi]
MTPDLSSRIEYSEKYVDDTHEYRYVSHPRLTRSSPANATKLAIIAQRRFCIRQYNN